MATTLSRASFTNQPIGRVNLKLVAMGTIAVGDTLTVTNPDGSAITGSVKKFIGSTSIKLGVISSNRPSSFLLLRQGATVA